MCLNTSFTYNSCCIFSEDQAKLAARKYARIVQKLGFVVSRPALQIENGQ